MKVKILKIAKTVLILTIWFSIPITLAQSLPQRMSYQTVIRNAGNVLVANANVGIRIRIVDEINGPFVYSETHSVVTNENGLATLEIGGGTVEFGDFSTILWANSRHFVQTDIDPTGGTDYTISGSSEILSVPYAQLSKKAILPTYPVSASDDSTTYLEVTDRNTWVDDPQISLIVPESGKYMLSFYAKAVNGNTYNNDATGFDSSCEVRVFNSTTATELFSHDATRYQQDSAGGIFYYSRYISLNPSRSMIVNLNQDDELKIQYNQFSIGSPVPTFPWAIVNGGISIIKIGN